MTTTYIAFTGSPTLPFSTSITLDGATYTLATQWNLFGQRYYVKLTDETGTVVLFHPMIGSPLGTNISITDGFFTTQLVWRVQNRQFEVIDA